MKQTVANFEEFSRLYNRKDARFIHTRYGRAFCEYFDITNRPDILHADKTEATLLIVRLVAETFPNE